PEARCAAWHGMAQAGPVAGGAAAVPDLDEEPVRSRRDRDRSAVLDFVGVAEPTADAAEEDRAIVELHEDRVVARQLDHGVDVSAGVVDVDDAVDDRVSDLAAVDGVEADRVAVALVDRVDRLAH